MILKVYKYSAQIWKNVYGLGPKEYLTTGPTDPNHGFQTSLDGNGAIALQAILLKKSRRKMKKFTIILIKN